LAGEGGDGRAWCFPKVKPSYSFRGEWMPWTQKHTPYLVFFATVPFAAAPPAAMWFEESDTLSPSHISLRSRQSMYPSLWPQQLVYGWACDTSHASEIQTQHFIRNREQQKLSIGLWKIFSNIIF
jgi:hypothetical protein